MHRRKQDVVSMSDYVKSQIVRTSIWTTSKKFRKLDVVQKLLYLFLLTNHQHSLAGAFEMFEDDIAHYTGIDVRNLPHVFQALEREGLATYQDGWVILLSYKVKKTNPSIAKRIEKDRVLIPQHVLEILDGDRVSTECTQSGDRVSTECTQPVRHSDLDLDPDLDSDLDSDIEDKTPKKVAAKPALPVALKDTFQNEVDTWFYSLYPYTSFGKERKAVASLVAKAKRQGSEMGVDPHEVMFATLDAYKDLVTTGDKFWTKQPLTPSSLLALWDRVVSEKRASQPKPMSEGTREFLEEVYAKR